MPAIQFIGVRKPKHVTFGVVDIETQSLLGEINFSEGDGCYYFEPDSNLKQEDLNSEQLIMIMDFVKQQNKELDHGTRSTEG